MCLFFFWKKNIKLFPLTLLVSIPSGPAPPFSFFFLPAQLLPAQPSPAGPAVSLGPLRPSPTPLTPTGRPHLSGSSSSSRARLAAASGPARAPPLQVDPSARANPHAEDPPHHSRSAPASDPTPPLHACLARTLTRVGRGHASPGILNPHVETDHGAI